MPTKFEPATGNPRLNGVIVDADEKTGRATAITRISYSSRARGAGTPTRAGGLTRSMKQHEPASICPFEEPEPPEADGSPSREPRCRAPRRVLTVSRADRPHPHAARRASSSRSGSKASCRTASVWNTGHMYFTLKDARRADQGRDVPLGAALPALQAAGRAARRRARRGSASTTRRASTRSSASTSSPRGSARGSSPSSN